MYPPGWTNVCWAFFFPGYTGQQGPKYHRTVSICKYIYHYIPLYTILYTIIYHYIPFIYHLYTIYIPFIYHSWGITQSCHGRWDLCGNSQPTGFVPRLVFIIRAIIAFWVSGLALGRHGGTGISWDATTIDGIYWDFFWMTSTSTQLHGFHAFQKKRSIWACPTVDSRIAHFMVIARGKIRMNHQMCWSPWKVAVPIRGL